MTETLTEQVGRAMSAANLGHILRHQREMNLRELGAEAAAALSAYLEAAQRNHREVIKKAFECDGTTESDFNRGYFAALTDMRMALNDLPLAKAA